MTGDDWHEYFEMFPDQNPANGRDAIAKPPTAHREKVAREQAALDAEMARIIAKHTKPNP